MNNKPGKLAAVIVTFNRLEKLQNTIEQTMLNDFDSIIVVNNCSTDGTQEWLETLTDQRLRVLHSDTNQGGAGGFGRGFAYVAESMPEIEWLVCYDDDAFPQPNVSTVFKSLSVPDNAGSLAAAVYLPNGEIAEMNRPSRNPFWHLREFLGAATRGRNGFHIDDEAYCSAIPIDIDTSSFVGCFIRLSLIREGKIGLPRSKLFIYADDIIYVLESKRAGYRHLFVPTLKFEHDCETLIDQQDIYYPLWKAYYVLRNRLEMYRVASGAFYPFIFLIKIPVFILSYRFYEKSEQRRFLQVARVAIWDGIRRNFEKKHAEVIALSSIKDK